MSKKRRMFGAGDETPETPEPVERVLPVVAPRAVEPVVKAKPPTRRRIAQLGAKEVFAE